MSNFGYIILTSLCVQHVLTVGINKTEILPTMEPYNRTHSKIFFEDSFYKLLKEYTAELTAFGEGKRRSEKIEKNLVKFQSCIRIKEFALVVEIYHQTHHTFLGPSQGFNYDPVNVSEVIKDYGCLNSDGTLGRTKKMKKKNKYFRVCFKKMEIVNVNKENITVTTTFYKTDDQEQNVTVTIEKEDLENCGNSTNEATLAVSIVIPVLILLGVFAAYSYYKRNKEIEDSKEEKDVNPTYGEVANNDYDYKNTELNNKNDYYDTEYTEGSKATEYNYQYDGTE